MYEKSVGMCMRSVGVHKKAVGTFGTFIRMYLFRSIGMFKTCNRIFRNFINISWNNYETILDIGGNI